MFAKALAENEEMRAFKNEVIKPIGKEIIELIRNHGLTTKQGQDVIAYVCFEIERIAENAKL